MQTTPPKPMNAAALSVAGNPAPSDKPALRLLAWALLKSERGQTICQHRLQVTS